MSDYIIEVKDLVKTSDTLEVIDPQANKVKSFNVKAIHSSNKGKISKAGAGYVITINAPFAINEGSLLRVKI